MFRYVVLTLWAVALLAVSGAALAGLHAAHRSSWSSNVAGGAATAGTTITNATGSSYAISAVVNGRPVRWNPCASIHWTANASAGPAGGLQVLTESVAAIAAATGTTWVYDGASAVTPDSAWLPSAPDADQPVLLGWADRTATDLLRTEPASVLGMTRTAWFSRRGLTGKVAATRGAVVALDAGKALPLRGAGSWSAVAVHELGHVMGLAHPHDGGELMSAVLPQQLTGLQAGDRAGLRLLGRSAGCINLAV